MKKIVYLFVLLLLTCGLACDDVVIGECPIAVGGDTVYVFPLETDHVVVSYVSYDPYITVKRNYKDDGYTVEFYEYIGQTINKVIVTLPSTHVYVLPMIREIGDDDFSYRLTFEWRGEDYY